MTTIVVVRKKNTVAIAADTQFSQGSTIVTGAGRLYPAKIHHVAGVYIGISGSSAHHAVFRSLTLKYPKLFNFEKADAIFETFLKIHPILKDEYFVETSEDDGDQEYESNQMSGLIISRGGVFSFFSYREIAEYECFWACGSGMEYALGALEVNHNLNKSALRIAELSVEVACKFDQGSGMPIESYEIALKNN